MPVIRDRTTYALDRDMSDVDALNSWTWADKTTLVAEKDGIIVGIRHRWPSSGSLPAPGAGVYRFAHDVPRTLAGACLTYTFHHHQSTAENS